MQGLVLGLGLLNLYSLDEVAVNIPDQPPHHAKPAPPHGSMPTHRTQPQTAQGARAGSAGANMPRSAGERGGKQAPRTAADAVDAGRSEKAPASRTAVDAVKATWGQAMAYAAKVMHSHIVHAVPLCSTMPCCTIYSFILSLSIFWDGILHCAIWWGVDARHCR